MAAITGKKLPQADAARRRVVEATAVDHAMQVLTDEIHHEGIADLPANERQQHRMRQQAPHDRCWRSSS
jgi:hypothetical protein